MSFVEFALDSRQLREWRKDMETAYLQAATDAVRETTREGEQALEKAMEAAGLGKLSKAPTSEVYPRKGRAYEPAGTITVKGRARTRGAFDAYTKGAKIQKEDGWLAIPTKEAGPRRFGRAKTSITPEEWERRTGIKLRYSKPPSLKGKALLIADKVVRTKAKRGGVRKATARRIAQNRDVESIVIFVLIPEVTITKRVDVDSVLAPYAGKLKTTFLEKVKKLEAGPSVAQAQTTK